MLWVQTWIDHLVCMLEVGLRIVWSEIKLFVWFYFGLIDWTEWAQKENKFGFGWTIRRHRLDWTGLVLNFFRSRSLECMDGCISWVRYHASERVSVAAKKRGSKLTTRRSHWLPPRSTGARLPPSPSNGARCRRRQPYLGCCHFRWLELAKIRRRRLEITRCPAVEWSSTSTTLIGFQNLMRPCTGLVWAQILVRGMDQFGLLEVLYVRSFF
jgi:hypothetical protein